MDYLLYLLIIYTLITGVTDLIYGKVHNIVSVAAFAAALIIKFLYAGTGETLMSIFAGFLCFMCFLPLFYLSIIGGGDVKMMFVLGFVVGYHKVADTVLVSFMLSAVFSLVIITVDGRYRIFLQRLKVFVISLLYPGVRTMVPGVRESLKAPLAFALGISAIITYTNIWVGLLK